MTNADILIELSGLSGPSGFEGEIAERVSELLAPYVNEMRIDALGNVIAVRRSGKPGAKRLLIDAHIDEIGLIVTGATDDGFLRFAKLGGLDARTLPAAEIKLLAEVPVLGIVDVLPPHVLTDGETEKVLKIEDLTVDIGASSKDEALTQVPIGTPGVANASARALGENVLCGKAFDDRAGIVAILRALEILEKTPLDIDVYVLASAQEEVGTRGAQPAAFGIAPDWAIIIDVDFATMPDSKPGAPRKFGGGVIISRGPNMNRALTDTVIELAKRHEIPYQTVVDPADSGTNASVVQVARDGVATALFGIPLKYMHTPVEMVNLEDVESAARLIYETVKALGGNGNV
jgi:endoglucanase